MAIKCGAELHWRQVRGAGILLVDERGFAESLCPKCGRKRRHRKARMGLKCTGADNAKR